MVMEMLLLLVTKPFSLICLIFLAGLRSVSLATLAWWHLVRGVVDFHVELCFKVLAWIMALVSLPIRILTALQRERTLDMHLHNLEAQLENIIWEKKELEERLHRAIKERKVIETVLEEIDVAHEKSLSRIDRLESKLQDLKEENLRLNEVQGKATWDYKARNDVQGKATWDYKARNDEIGNVYEGTPLSKHYGVPSWNTDYEGTGVTFQDVLMQRDSQGEVEKSKYQECSPFKPQKLFGDSIADEILERRRVVALSRSLFSSIMSLVVAMIIWEAEDPCMPLVASLFSVVGMSLNSVLRFFSTIKNKPAFDAVALLSVNWFILGTLTYPALPGVARMLAPRIIALGDRFVAWLGFSS